MELLPPIPVSNAQRWREFRMRIVPLLMFGIVLAAITLLWRNFVHPSGVVGEIQATQVEDALRLSDGSSAE